MPAPGTIALMGSASRQLSVLEGYLARHLFSWVRADYYAAAGAAVVAFPDKVVLESEGAAAPNARSVDSAHALTQSSGGNQVAIPAALPAAGGHLVADFTGVHWYDSSLPESAWTLHDGSGWQVWSVVVPSATGARILWSTADDAGIYFGAQVGVYHQLDGNAQQLGTFGSNAGARILGAAGNVSASMPVGSLTTTHYRFTTGETPEWEFGTTATPVAASGSAAATPAPGAPAATFRLGADSGEGLPFVGKVSEILIAKTGTPELSDMVARYLLARYS